jgi:hypothetical protein
MHDSTLPVFLIMDNCPSHNKQALLVLYAHHKIREIWLSAHSSYIYILSTAFGLGSLRRIEGKRSKIQQEAEEASVARQSPEN